MANIRPLSNGLAKKAKEELFEVESRIPEDLEALRSWIKKQPHLKTPLGLKTVPYNVTDKTKSNYNSLPIIMFACICKDDQFLVAFLRGSKYSLQRAKEKIENFFSVRQIMTDIFTDRDPRDSRNAELLRLGVSNVLPNPIGEDGPRLTIIRPGAYDPKKYTFQEVFKTIATFTDIIMLDDDNCIISGTIGILDLANVTLDHFLQFDLGLMKKLTVFSQEGQPFRQKGVHYINMPSTFQSVFNILKGFLSEKNKQRVFIHSSMESLYKHIPKENLPLEYGGLAGSFDEINNYSNKKILEHRDFLLEWDNYGTDETLRLHKSKILDELYGVDGSFRKLEVD